jgi:hypothetical protein
MNKNTLAKVSFFIDYEAETRKEKHFDYIDKK